MTAQKFRKRPVVIDAMPWDGTVEGATRVIDWVLSEGGTARYRERDQMVMHNTISIDTMEGTMSAYPGAVVIKGVRGEFYACDGEIFEETYEPAT